MYYVNKTLKKKNVQERLERSRLESQLDFIEKQKKCELKMHESEVRKIRARFLKTGVSSDAFSEAAGVKMYETHNPGFCYRRNGAYKIKPSISTQPVLDFKQIKSLLFRKDDLDIEKLLCLHILSMHKTESLAMPNSKYLKNIPSENTPLERLIQRSKKIGKEIKEDREILNSLPIFVVDVDTIRNHRATNDHSKDESVEQLPKDARITSKLIVNCKIQKILISALNALKNSKSEKLQQIFENCQNHIVLKKMFNKPEIQDFLKKLKNYTILTSCESYILTTKIKQEPIHLDVRTVFGNLESLVRHLRTYLLQIPSKMKNEWKSLYELNEDIMDDKLTKSISHQVTTDNKTVNQKKCSCSLYTAGQMKKPEVLQKNSSNSGNRSYRNMTDEGRNITKKVCSFEKRSETSGISSSKKKISAMSNSKTNQLPSIFSGQKLKMETIAERGSKNRTEADIEDVEVEVAQTQEGSFVRRTVCCACQEKWRLSLPPPKIPNYKRPGLPPAIYEDPYKIRNMNRISSKISQELYNLCSYDTKYSLNHFNARIRCPAVCRRPSSKENEVLHDGEFLEIDQYDLARVCQEIADRETEKKLDVFLKTTV